MNNLVTGSQCRYLKITGVHLWYSSSPMLHCSSFVSSWFEPLCLRFFNLRKFSNRHFTFVVCQDGHVTHFFFWFFLFCNSDFCNVTYFTWLLCCHTQLLHSSLNRNICRRVKEQKWWRIARPSSIVSFCFPCETCPALLTLPPRDVLFTCTLSCICLPCRDDLHALVLCSYSSLPLRYLSRLEGTVFQQPLIALCTNLVMGL